MSRREKKQHRDCEDCIAYLSGLVHYNYSENMKRDDYRDRVKRLREQVTKGLEKSNKVKLGDGYLVRIPKIQGRINRIKRDDRTYVEYIYERGYDPETKQSRNK